jgi:hypothetical protein
MNSNDRIAATVSSLGTWFVSEMNTLHKGAQDNDNNDNDNNNNNNNNNIATHFVTVSTTFLILSLIL